MESKEMDISLPIDTSKFDLSKIKYIRDEIIGNRDLKRQYFTQGILIE